MSKNKIQSVFMALSEPLSTVFAVDKTHHAAAQPAGYSAAAPETAAFSAMAAKNASGAVPAEIRDAAVITDNAFITAGRTDAAQSVQYTPTPNGWVNLAAGLVAHGGGGIDGYAVTDSLDAVIRNYGLGHRVFELDLNLTSDGVLVGVHDWGKNKTAPTWAEFSKTKIQDRYAPFSFEQIVRLMTLYKDMYIVTDTKSFDYTEKGMLKQFQAMYDAVEKIAPAVRQRIVVQIYNQDMYYKINKIYKYPNILYTLYETPDTEAQVLAFVKKENIKVIVMPPERANQKFLDQLNAQGGKVFLHTLNDKEEIRRWNQKGVWGFYTDFLTPKDFGGR